MFNVSAQKASHETFADHLMPVAGNGLGGEWQQGVMAHAKPDSDACQSHMLTVSYAAHPQACTAMLIGLVASSLAIPR